MLDRHGGGVGEIPTKQGYVDHNTEFGFYAKITKKPSNGFEQESHLLAFNLITVQKGYVDCWIEKGLQGSKLGRVEIRGLLQNHRQERLVPWT